MEKKPRIAMTVSDLLWAVSIEDAIKYYGVTELLDNIGMEAIKDHVDSSEEEQ